jgi:hypothetical protein
MAKKIAFSMTLNSITVNYDGETHIVRSEDTAYEKVKVALKERRFDDIPGLMSPAKHIEKASGGLFQVRDGDVFIDGVKVPGTLGRKILAFREDGLPFEPLVAFARKLQNNPSYRSVNQLFQFLEANDHPLTEEGNFIAYKKVTRCEDGVLRDTRTKTIVNEVGSVCEMARNQVNEDPEQTCSHGLHVANWDYAQNHYGGYGDPMLEVEVDPADVVAVPVDYNASKMRVCKYRVRAEVVNPNANKHLVRNHLPESSVLHDDGPEPKDEISEQEERGKNCVDCENCEGTGANPDSDGDCPECSGSGCVASSEAQDQPEETEESDTQPVLPNLSSAPSTFHDEASIRKMSTERLEKYRTKLLGMGNSTAQTDCLDIVEKVLDDRGWDDSESEDEDDDE